MTPTPRPEPKTLPLQLADDLIAQRKRIPSRIALILGGGILLLDFFRIIGDWLVGLGVFLGSIFVLTILRSDRRFFRAQACPDCGSPLDYGSIRKNRLHLRCSSCDREYPTDIGYSYGGATPIRIDWKDV